MRMVLVTISWLLVVGLLDPTTGTASLRMRTGGAHGGVVLDELVRQAMDLIRYHRGRIVLLDRPGLERLVCECYRVVMDEFTRLLG